MGNGQSLAQQREEESYFRTKFLHSLNQRLQRCLGIPSVHVHITPWEETEFDEYAAGHVLQVHFNIAPQTTISSIAVLRPYSSYNLEINSETGVGWRRLGLNQFLRAVTIAYLCRLPHIRGRYNVLFNAENWLSAYVLGRDYKWSARSNVKMTVWSRSVFAERGQYGTLKREISQEDFMHGMYLLRRDALHMGNDRQPPPRGYITAYIEVPIDDINCEKAANKLTAYVGNTTGDVLGTLGRNDLAPEIRAFLNEEAGEHAEAAPGAEAADQAAAGGGEAAVVAAGPNDAAAAGAPAAMQPIRAEVVGGRTMAF